MPRQTLKSLQAQIDNLRELREGDSKHMQWQTAEIDSLRKKIEGMHGHHEQLKREIGWHKQLSQNLSEAICAHMRSR